jgi:hypothetical protein
MCETLVHQLMEGKLKKEGFESTSPTNGEELVQIT